jgi:Sec-independent protein translocase protein TatA
MGDVARGIKSFKKGMQDEDTVAAGRNESLERKADPAEASAETAKSKGRDAA